MTQSRCMLVLCAIVEDHIRSQEPMGSVSLACDHDLGASSATIRNGTAALKNEGYLIQPHILTGHVPTEKGYRYFVDRFVTVVPLSEAQRRGISSFLSGSMSLEDVLQCPARLLSEITGRVAVVASPSLVKTTLWHVEMVPATMTMLPVVVIIDTDRVAQHGPTIASTPAVDRVNRLFSTVSGQYDRLSLSKLTETMRSVVASAGYESVRGAIDVLIDAFKSMVLDERTNKLYMSGTSHLTCSRLLVDLTPSFDMLEEQVALVKPMSNLSEETNASGVDVAIDSEMYTPGLLHASVISSGYGCSGAAGESAGNNPINELEAESEMESQTSDAEPIVFAGSIGPTHIDYAATMAAVRVVARYSTAFLSEGRTQD